MANYKVGDRVAVLRQWTPAPIAILTVKSVGKLKIVLDDGSRWRARWGRRWNSVGCTDWIRPVEDGDEELMLSHQARLSAMRVIDSVRWSDLSSRTLIAVADILRADKEWQVQ